MSSMVTEVYGIPKTDRNTVFRIQMYGTRRYDKCSYRSMTGVLRNESVKRLPYTEAPAKKTPAVGDLLERVSFFKERFVPENSE